MKLIVEILIVYAVSMSSIILFVMGMNMMFAFAKKKVVVLRKKLTSRKGNRYE